MKRTRHLTLQALSVVVIGLLLVQTVAAGQSTEGLAIQILKANEGDNSIDKELPPLKIRVKNLAGRAISGASVQFRAPEDGPTGYFLPDSSQITVTTDAKGMATAPRFRTNSKVGDYELQIVASYRDSFSRAAIPQTNIFEPKSSNKKFIIISALIGGAAVAALASRRGNSGSVSSALEALATPTINIGGSSVEMSPTTLAPAPTMPSGDTLLSPPADSGSIDPTPAPSPCAGVPPTSNRRECR